MSGRQIELRVCDACGDVFEARGRRKRCSIECSHAVMLAKVRARQRGLTWHSPVLPGRSFVTVDAAPRVSAPARRDRRIPRRPVVYVIGSELSGVVKIGHTDDLSGRLAGMQTGSPVRLSVLWQLEHPRNAEIEDALHAWFRRVRIHGEHFNFGKEDPVAAVSAAAERMLASGRFGSADLGVDTLF